MSSRHPSGTISNGDIILASANADDEIISLPQEMSRFVPSKLVSVPYSTY